MTKDPQAQALGGEDPYEIEWPDDAKELRQQQRAAAAKAAAVRPAPRALTALILGLATSFLFQIPVGVAGSAPAFAVATALPIFLAALVIAWPTYLALGWATRKMPRGIPDLAFIFVGGAIGYGLTYGAITAWPGLFGVDVFQFPVVRSVSSIFMFTSTATSFYLAFLLTEKVRRLPKVLWPLGGFVTLIVGLSIFVNI